MHRVSPSSSAHHKSLHSEIQKAGFDPEILRNVLWLINDHDRLIAFPRMCGNIINIIGEAKAAWGNSSIPTTLEEAFPLLRWISERGASLRAIGPEFNRQPKAAMIIRSWAGEQADIPCTPRSGIPARSQN